MGYSTSLRSDPLVDVPLIVELLEDVLNALFVAFVGSPYEMAVGRAHKVPKRTDLSKRLRQRTPWVTTPASRALFSIFCPCSSVPVRKYTSKPR